eukprot:s3095_g5.t1
MDTNYHCPLGMVIYEYKHERCDAVPRKPQETSEASPQAKGPAKEQAPDEEEEEPPPGTKEPEAAESQASDGTGAAFAGEGPLDDQEAPTSPGAGEEEAPASPAAGEEEVDRPPVHAFLAPLPAPEEETPPPAAAISPDAEAEAADADAAAEQDKREVLPADLQPQVEVHHHPEQPPLEQAPKADEECIQEEPTEQQKAEPVRKKATPLPTNARGKVEWYALDAADSDQEDPFPTLVPEPRQSEPEGAAATQEAEAVRTTPDAASPLEVGTPPREETNLSEAMARSGGYPDEGDLLQQKAPAPYQQPMHRKVLLRENSPGQKPSKEVNGNAVKHPSKAAGFGKEAIRPRLLQRPQPANVSQAPPAEPTMADCTALPTMMVPPPPPPTHPGGPAQAWPSPIRILQRVAPKAEPAPTLTPEDEDEDDDELDDPVPNPRRSWRCASAGKSEGVGGARRTPAPTAKRAARGAAKPKAKAPSSEKPETPEKLEMSEKPEKKSGRRSRRSDSRGGPGTLPPPPPPPPPRPERQAAPESPPAPPPAPPPPPPEAPADDASEDLDPTPEPPPTQSARGGSKRSSFRRGTRGGARQASRRQGSDTPQAGTAAEWLDADRKANGTVPRVELSLGFWILGFKVFRACETLYSRGS